MCIAIAKKAGIKISEDILERCFHKNPDGAGFTVEINDKLTIFKGYFTFKSFMEAFEPYQEQKAMIHFRILTHGDLSEENCHPFEVTENIHFTHNGIITNVTAKGTESDTHVFNSQYLKDIVKNYGEKALFDPIIKNLIQKFIGYSKLVFFVKGEEDFLIYNEHLGNTSSDGVWFSNTGWLEPKPTPPVQNKGYWGNQKWKEQPSKFMKKELEILKSQGKDFFVGSLVEINYTLHTPILGNKQTKRVEKGAIGEVMKMYTNNTLDIMFDSETTLNVYPYSLTVLDVYELPLLLN